ncbi:MAG: hypothetical protein IV112_08475 [Methyloversatilis discipulorum]|uniref:hypothetical protein n=1 Tax=Methyloversatilis discipulorum TaxID=1119528 RepID=UPI0026EE6841|nr:hypothetical protein [Methyloversatilis discipulorum]MBT9516715.1 hypothetical protein [Methyloversatilis discipulorum]
MKMTAEERRARERIKKEEWQQEIARLNARKHRTTEPDARDRRKAAERRAFEQKLAERLHSREFKSWYESTTGEPVGVFLDAAAEIEARRLDCTSRIDWTEWVQDRIQGITDRHIWTNPETKAFWAEQVAAARSPRERRFLLHRLATPTWANREAMLAIYRQRDQLVAQTGIPHDVDHIIPLVSRYVCGLHCEFNLRAIPATENRRKSNRFTPG